MAFGTGTHPTTQLCLELMEQAIDEFRESNIEFRMIDVGCGSGILSIAALKLGAKQALGVDIDKGSIKNSRENAIVNGIGDEFMLGIGSVEEVRNGTFAYRKAPLVLANILAPVIVRLFDSGLADLLEENGVIILSGILQEQEERVVVAAQGKGLRTIERRQTGDWVALTMRR